MTRFDQCLKFVLASEGGFVDDPTDRGGATNFGVTQVTYDTYRDKLGVPRQSVKNISNDEVKVIYAKQYWCDGLPPPLDLLVFDSSVQHGTSRARKWLQRCVGVHDDGVVGAATMSAVNVADKHALVEKYFAIRDAFYERIISNDPSQEKFRRGWANRMSHLRQEITKA